MCCPDEAIHPIDHTMAIVCLLLNIFLPGVGTIVHACMGTNSGPGIIYGILQILTTGFFIGWIWSIIYGVKIVGKSGKSGCYEHHWSPQLAPVHAWLTLFLKIYIAT